MSTTVSYKGNTIATVYNETKTLTTAGTWVEGDIEITDSSPTSGVGELVTDNGYIILDDDPISTTIRQLSGSDVGAELVSGYYKIPENYVGYFSGIYSIIPVLTHDWDLTESLTDSISGATITLTNNATRDSNGISLSAGNNYATIPVKYRPYHSYEFDIVSMTPSTGSSHGRLIMFSSTEGLIYRAGANWSAYLNGGWESNWSSDGTLFVGTTITVTVENGPPKFYIDGELWKTATRTQSLSGTTNIMIGSSGGTSFYSVVVSGVRIYEGVKYRNE